MSARILDYLKRDGEQLDVNMAVALRIPMSELKTMIEQLSASGEIICCHVTRFIEGNKIEGISCRLSCDPPALARGRKPGKKETLVDFFPE